MGDAGGVSGPTGTTVDRRGSDPEAGLSGRVCEDAVEYWALERKAVAEDDEEEEYYEDTAKNLDRLFRQHQQALFAKGRARIQELNEDDEVAPPLVPATAPPALTVPSALKKKGIASICI